MNHKKRNWSYTRIGKFLNGFLLIVSFFIILGSYYFCKRGISYYGIDILKEKNLNYYHTENYKYNLKNEIELLLKQVETSYETDISKLSTHPFGITDVSTNKIYYYDFWKMRENGLLDNQHLDDLSELKSYRSGEHEFKQDYFTNYENLVEYLNSPYAVNNYLYFTDDAFRGLFEKVGLINKNHRFSEKFSEKSYFVFKDIDEKSKIDQEDDVKVVMPEEIYAVYDPIQKVYYSTKDQYFAPMECYIYETKALKELLETEEKKGENIHNIIMPLLKLYNYNTLSAILEHSNTLCEEYIEDKKELENRKHDSFFVYDIINPEYHLTNIDKNAKIKMNQLEDVYIYDNAKGEFQRKTNAKEHFTLYDEMSLIEKEKLKQHLVDTRITIGINKKEISDSPIYYGNQTLERYKKWIGKVVFLGIFFGIIFLIQAITLCRTTGRIQKGNKLLELNHFDELPMEGWIFSSIVCLGFALLLGGKIILFFDYYRIQSGFNPGKGYYMISIFPFVLMVMLIILSFVRRIKAHNIKNKIILLHYLKKWKEKGKDFYKKRKPTEKLIVFFLIYLLLVFFALIILQRLNWKIGVIIFSGIQMGAFLILYLWIRDMTILNKAVSEIVKGNMEYRCELNGHFSMLRNLKDDINHIGDGLKTAIESSVKNEKMRTELITNVSHDLKTPLTSIINYVNLLSKQKMPTEEARHYVEVLEEKSQRLKHLTEDLVEAAKANSGNIELEKIPLAFDELMRQAFGEFEDKFRTRNLTVVTRYPEEKVMILADSRRMFRVIENILQNAYKYAQEGTRIYADIVKEKGKVQFTLKNISSAQLNISVEELMERFTRGDDSRTTEGSGLGLSIAKDLTKLQGGTFELALDGDLFKVIITFSELGNEDIEEAK